MAEQEKDTVGAKANTSEEDFDMDDDDDEEKDREFVIRIRPPKFLPGEARTHVRAARKEMLLAVRSVLDAVIDKIDEPEKRSKRRNKIEVG